MQDKCLHHLITSSVCAFYIIFSKIWKSQSELSHFLLIKDNQLSEHGCKYTVLLLVDMSQLFYGSIRDFACAFIFFNFFKNFKIRDL